MLVEGVLVGVGVNVGVVVFVGVLVGVIVFVGVKVGVCVGVGVRHETLAGEFNLTKPWFGLV